MHRLTNRKLRVSPWSKPGKRNRSTKNAILLHRKGQSCSILLNLANREHSGVAEAHNQVVSGRQRAQYGPPFPACTWACGRESLSMPGRSDCSALLKHAPVGDGRTPQECSPQLKAVVPGGSVMPETKSVGENTESALIKVERLFLTESHFFIVSSESNSTKQQQSPHFP